MFTLTDGYSVTKTREEAFIETAKNLLRENLDLDLIARATKLPIEKILQIKGDLEKIED